MNDRHPGDLGPIYTETNMLQFPVEPWNAVSNLIFLLIILYWLPKVHGNYSRHLLFAVGLPLLAVGFVGGTVFHATRSHNIWLVMDYMPIFILMTLTAFHLWYLVTKRTLLSLIINAFAFLSSLSLRSILDLPRSARISIGYAIASCIIILPAIILSWKHNWHKVYLLFITLLSFAVAVIFRQIDKGYGAELFPMGSHFLWHIFGGVSVFYLMKFIYTYEILDLQTASINVQEKV